MPELGQTAESFLGIPGIANVARNAAPVGSGLGSNSPAVSLTQRAFLDKNLLDQTVDILDKANRVRSFLDQQKSRAAGQAVLGDLSQLDPSDPTYLQKRDALFAQNPDALLDKTAMNFLGLQEDTFRLIHEERAFDRRLKREDDVYQRRTDDALKKQETYDENMRNREIDREVRNLGPGALLKFNEATTRETNPLSPKDAFKKAHLYQQDRAIRAKLLESGVPIAKLKELETEGFDGQRVINVELAEPILSELLQDQAQIEDWKFEITGIQNTIRELRRDMDDELDDDAKKAINADIKDLQNQMNSRYVWIEDIHKKRNKREDETGGPTSREENSTTSKTPVAPDPHEG